MEKPLVTVLIPCYNAEKFLKEALDSIANQTYENLEILCINDGSADRTGEILESFALKDPRFRILNNEENIKLISTLNKGIELARGEYIARMDADDISSPERIETEINFLLKNPNIGLVSTIAEYISEENRHVFYQTKKCQTYLGCLFTSFLATPILHAAIVAKTSVLRLYGYEVSEESIHTEDYLLWTKLLVDGIKVSNINKPLYKIRINPKSVSYSFEDLQIKNFTKCAHRHINNYFNENIPIEVTSVIVNRVSHKTNCRDLRKGWKKLNKLKKKFIIKEDVSKQRNVLLEINQRIRQQKIDIALQSIKRGKLNLKFIALLLMLGNFNVLLPFQSINYLSGKIKKSR